MRFFSRMLACLLGLCASVSWADTNVALGRPYTTSSAASSAYPDTGGKELTDGKTDPTATYTNPAWQGRIRTSYSHTIDLGSNLSINKILAGFMQIPSAGIAYPVSVSCACSADGRTFTNLGSAAARTPAGKCRTFKWIGTAATARYVRVTVKGSGSWIFEDEVEVWSPSAPPPDPLLIKGSFFQIYTVSSWTTSTWATLYADMKAAKISDGVIWQWTCDGKAKRTYYPTAMPGFTKLAGLASGDPVADSLAQASAAGTKVWLGLVWSDDWWSHYANDAAWLSTQTGYSTTNAQELWDRYGSAYGNAIAGFYIPMEVENEHFSTPAAQDTITNAFATICDYVHAHCGGKPVMVSPFCSDGASMSPLAYQDCWTHILGSAAIDVLALQDGCGASDDGVNTHTTISTVGGWLRAMKNAIAAARPATQLWANVETFSMDAVGNLTPAPESRIEAQILAESGYVSKIISFSAVEFQAPVTGHLDPYNAYKSYALMQSQP